MRVVKNSRWVGPPISPIVSAPRPNFSNPAAGRLLGHLLGKFTQRDVAPFCAPVNRRDPLRFIQGENAFGPYVGFCFPSYKLKIDNPLDQDFYWVNRFLEFMQGKENYIQKMGLGDFKFFADVLTAPFSPTFWTPKKPQSFWVFLQAGTAGNTVATKQNAGACFSRLNQTVYPDRLFDTLDSQVELRIIRPAVDNPIDFRTEKIAGGRKFFFRMAHPSDAVQKMIAKIDGPTRNDYIQAVADDIRQKIPVLAKAPLREFCERDGIGPHLFVSIQLQPGPSRDHPKDRAFYIGLCIRSYQLSTEEKLTLGEETTHFRKSFQDHRSPGR